MRTLDTDCLLSDPAGLWLDLQAGTGVVYFATDAGGSRGGAHSAFSAIEETLASGRVSP